VHTRTLDWYLGRAFAGWIVIVLIALLAILQVLDLIGESNKILAAPGATEASLWRYVGLRLPVLASEFLPFAVLLAALITLTILAYSSEIIIMKSCGMSPHRLLLPLMGVAAVCAVIHFIANETIVVRAAERLQAWQSTDYGAKPEPSPDTTREVWAEAGGTIIRARRVAQHGASAALEDIAVFRRSNDGTLDTVTFAKRGEITPGGGTLEDVQDIDLVANIASLVPERTWDPGVAPAQLLTLVVDPTHVSFTSLRDAIRLMQRSGKGVQPLITDLHHKIAGPLSSVLMPLLAGIAAFGLARRRTVLLRASLGLMLGFAFFLADGLMTALGRSLALPPQIAAWLAILIFTVGSQAMLFHTEE
jgi:lipopolysaccharide export system permease protein